MTRQTILRALLGLAALASAAFAGPAAAQDQARKFKVYVATWRGCEEVCQAFKQYLLSQNLAIDFVDRSADRSMDALPKMVAEAREMKPDLIATWGTAITLAFVGPHDAVDPKQHITDIPVVYMYVTDPVGSKIARGPEKSGRRNVAGAHYAIPGETQIRAMQSYRPVKTIALLYTRDEANSVSAKEELKEAAEKRGIRVVEREIALGDDGRPRPDDLPRAIADVAKEEPAFIAFGSSSFLMSRIAEFTNMANAAKIPVFSTGEKVLTEGNGLLGLTGALRNIGQVSAYQAQKILAEGAVPGELPSTRLSRFTLTVKMPVARLLELYPPMTILRYAELME